MIESAINTAYSPHDRQRAINLIDCFLKLDLASYTFEDSDAFTSRVETLFMLDRQIYDLDDLS